MTTDPIRRAYDALPLAGLGISFESACRDYLPTLQRTAATQAELMRHVMRRQYERVMDDDGFPADQDEEMTVGLDCCPHMVPYGSDCDECDEDDADASMGLTPNRQYERVMDDYELTDATAHLGEVP